MLSLALSLALATPPNILLVLADDVSAYRLRAYGETLDTPTTPTIDRLADEGVLFSDAYAAPSCSPTRASLWTGLYPRRHGIGGLIKAKADHAALELNTSFWTLPKTLRAAGYSTGIAGKWHLAGYESPNNLTHPMAIGFDEHRGPFANLRQTSTERVGSYYGWERLSNGVPFWSTVYATTQQADDAIELARLMPEPWFLVLAFSAPHVPLHLPPAALRTIDVDASSPDGDKVDAALEALDAELGRVLEALCDYTPTVIFMGDNGTASEATRPPYDPERAKGTVYQGGVRVPLIVSGPGIFSHVDSTMAHAVDIAPTVLDLAGLPVPLGLDGRSLAPWIYDTTLPLYRPVIVERFKPHGFGPFDTDEVAAIERRWKLIDLDGAEDLYRLTDWRDEQPESRPYTNEAADAYARLRPLIDNHR